MGNPDILLTQKLVHRRPYAYPHNHTSLVQHLQYPPCYHGQRHCLAPPVHQQFLVIH